jgi:hypothetical protein
VVLRLGKAYGDERLEAACRRALTLGSHSYKSIESILKHRLDGKPLVEQQELGDWRLAVQRKPLRKIEPPE